ncbi:MAG: hypothetical protein E6279_10545, partial [Streptococcus sp.]|nr:hypothetical protein [Streptococcus sp.]
MKTTTNSEKAQEIYTFQKSTAIGSRSLLTEFDARQRLAQPCQRRVVLARPEQGLRAGAQFFGSRR